MTLFVTTVGSPANQNVYCTGGKVRRADDPQRSRSWGFEKKKRRQKQKQKQNKTDLVVPRFDHSPVAFTQGGLEFTSRHDGQMS